MKKISLIDSSKEQNLTTGALDDLLKVDDAETQKEKKSGVKTPALFQSHVEAELEELGIMVRKNVLSGRVEIEGLPPVYSQENAHNILPVFLWDCLRAKGFKPSQSVLDGYIGAIADIYRYNPVEKMLKRLRWDRKDRLLELFTMMGIMDDADGMRLVTKWLHQCVTLVLNDEKNPPILN